MIKCVRSGGRPGPGGVADDVEKRVQAIAKICQKAATSSRAARVQTMKSSFTGLGIGLLGAIVLAYLLIVVNFQSWLDPSSLSRRCPAPLRASADAAAYPHNVECASLTGRYYVHGGSNRQAS